MEVIEKLLTRLRHTGALLLIGLILIIYIAFGFLYWQQGLQQRKLGEQIANISAVVARPLASIEALQAEYDNVTSSLALIMTDVDAIAILVDKAKENGIIDVVDEASGKFIVPPVTLSQAKVGGGTYQLLSFRNIHVQGDNDKVMAFISVLDSGEIVLDSGKTLKTMVLKRVQISQEASGIETVAIVDVDIYTKLKK